MIVPARDIGPLLQQAAVLADAAHVDGHADLLRRQVHIDVVQVVAHALLRCSNDSFFNFVQKNIVYIFIRNKLIQKISLYIYIQ